MHGKSSRCKDSDQNNKIIEYPILIIFNIVQWYATTNKFKKKKEDNKDLKSSIKKNCHEGGLFRNAGSEL